MDQESFWNRSFLVALGGYFFLFMSMTLFFIFPLYLEQLNASKSQIGLIMGVHSLTAIFVRPVFGRLIDLKGRKNISLWGLALLFLVIPGFYLMQDAGWFPIMLRALTGIGWGISMTATITICSDLAPVNRLARSMGIIGVAGLLSAALGPMLGEEIFLRSGPHGLFFTCQLFLGISFLFILFTREIRPPDNQNHGSSPLKLRQISVVTGLLIASMVVSHGAIRSSVVNFIALFTTSIPLDRVAPFFLMFSGAAIATRLFFGDLSDRYGRKQVIFPSAILIAVNLFLLSQMRSPGVLMLTGALGGFGQGLIFPALSTYIIDTLGRAHKGLAISLYLTFFDVGMAGGGVLFGWISDLHGFRVMYLVAAGGLFLMASLFTWAAPNPQPIGD